MLSPVSFQVIAGDKIGLVGRNGAGKTTLTLLLAGESLPAAGTVSRTGQIGYLPQDPRTGDLGQLARDRILSARGLDSILRRLTSLGRIKLSADRSPVSNDREGPLNSQST